MEKNKTTIHTIRHGQTDFNVQKRYAGTIDVPLNRSGKESSMQASKALVGLHFDAVITSASKRTIETAQYLLGDSIRLVQCELCNERDYGQMQGQTADEVELLKPTILYIKVGGDYHSINPPGGETFEQLRERADKFRHFILKKYSCLDVLVVSHGIFLQQFHGLLRGQSWNQALARAVPSLALTSFCLSREALVRETSTVLLDYDQSSW